MTSPPSAMEPVRVAVLGSCVTRDNFNTRFNPDYKQWYETVLMQNQSSIISMMSPPTPITSEELGTGTDYDLWNVRTDFSKEFLTELGDIAPDYLILDFFGDIHFGVLRLADGSFVTDNRWKLWKTPYYQALKAAEPLDELRIERDTDAYLSLWKEAFDRLVAHVGEVAPETSVIVHRGHNTGSLILAETGEKVPLQQHRKLAPIDVARYNELWAQLDDYAGATTGFATIDLTGREYPTFDAHPWGPYYVHYAMGYYVDFLTALNRLHLERVLRDRPPALPEMLHQVLRRTEEQAESQETRDLTAKEADFAHQLARQRAAADLAARKAAIIAEQNRRRSAGELAAQKAVVNRQNAKLLKQAARIKQLESRAPEVLARKVLTRLRRP